MLSTLTPFFLITAEWLSSTHCYYFPLVFLSWPDAPTCTFVVCSTPHTVSKRLFFVSDELCFNSSSDDVTVMSRG